MSRLRDLASVAKQRVLPNRGFPFVHAVEEPAADVQPAAHTVRVKGWLLVPSGRHVDGVAVVHSSTGGTRTPLQQVERPDVGVRWPRHTVLGFQGIVPVGETNVGDDPAGDGWCLEVRTADGTFTCAIDAAVDEDARARFPEQKAAKVARIASLLRCPRPRDGDESGPSCLGELEPADDDVLVCMRCGTRFARRPGCYDFLTEELRAIGAIEPTDAISSWGYDPIAAALIERCRDGLVLDAGSGLKADYLDNVVNLEVADYPTTDVLAIGERLPFADDSFDGVLSLVVLEHVRDPFRSAAEITRVLRPGGRLYVAVPFLQPYHGYPHHYYNMTRRGLEQLFVESFDIEQCDTAPYGFPVFTLTWFLRSYLEGLPKGTARRLADMRVRDLLDDGHDYLDERFVRDLSAAAIEELACSNFLLGTKR